MAYHARHVFVLLGVIFMYLKTGLKYQRQVPLKTTTTKAVYLSLLESAELAEERKIL